MELKVVKGMKDILPSEIPAWHYLEQKLSQLAARYGYQEIRLPIVEQTELFKRAIGEVTDIVEKEMYTFIDRNGESLSLRPEGTAQCVRALINSSLIRNSSQRVWYFGPMFRRENPQKGRYRQFYQFGIEAFGLSGPDIDIEQLLMIARLWRELALDKITLQINSLGTAIERAHYRQALVTYLAKQSLDEDSQRRLATNPLRILDSKNPAMQTIIEKAPRLLDFLSNESLTHFESICQLLDSAHINYQVNPRLVRGIDYYTHVVYEWVAQGLGAQATVCAGGRYNDLVSQMGASNTSAVGFSIGIERLLMLLAHYQSIPPHQPLEVYLVTQEQAQTKALLIAEQLRDALPLVRLLTHCGGGNFKSQFKRADKSQAKFAVIIGEQELENNTLGIKDLVTQSQQTLPFAQAIDYLKQQLG